jgi:hypothetical protein
MDLISVLLVLVVVGIAMYLIRAYVPTPFSWILLVICGIVLLVFVLQIVGFTDLGSIRVGGRSG